MKLEGNVIAVFQSKEEQQVKVWQNEAFNWLCAGDDTIHSIISRHSPYRLVSPFHQHMAAVLLLKHQPRSILFLGVGGGDLARFFNHYWPQAQLEGVEINSEVIKAAKIYFSLPLQLQIHHQKAEDFVSAMPPIQMDIIFVDLFSSSQMYKQNNYFEFLSHCFHCLSPQGVMVINLSYSEEILYIENLFQIRQLTKKTLYLSAPNYNNLLVSVLGNQIPVITIAKLLNQANTLEQKCHLDFIALANKLIRLNPHIIQT